MGKKNRNIRGNVRLESLLKWLKYFYFREHGFAIITDMLRKKSQIFFWLILHRTCINYFWIPLLPTGIHLASTPVIPNLAIQFQAKGPTTPINDQNITKLPIQR
jgi:hypothetical protein